MIFQRVEKKQLFSELSVSQDSDAGNTNRHFSHTKKINKENFFNPSQMEELKPVGLMKHEFENRD